MAYAFTTNGATPTAMGGSTPINLGTTPQSRALNSVALPPTVPLIPPSSATEPQIKSHSIQHPDGTLVTQTFHAPKESGMLQKPVQPQTVQPPTIKMVNGIHHVPFTDKDGSTKYINAHGQVIQ